MTDDAPYDALVLGGGPGGAVAALTLARAGKRVLVAEKDAHPRFHLGESILPRAEPLLRELGLSERVRTLPHLPKYGAEFGFGDGTPTMTFGFADGLLPGFPIFNLERAAFDALLLDVARESGAEVRERCGCRQIEKLADGDVRAALGDGTTVRARVLIDASGHGTVVGRHLGTRRNFDEPALRKVAYFGHFEGVEHLPGRAAGNAGIFMCDEGWFWVIGLRPGKTSVGFVASPDLARAVGVPADRMLRWAVDRCPAVRARMRAATGSDRNGTVSDFSYTCAPHAGAGHFLVGDAGCFLDPIFSTGATLAMVGGREAAKLTLAALDGKMSWRKAQARYARFVTGSTGVFWKLIRAYYRHEFRELFMNGTGPFGVHRAVISTLAGQVFPRPAFALRWRLRLFFAYAAAQALVPLVPRRARFSLRATAPIVRSFETVEELAAVA